MEDYNEIAVDDEVAAITSFNEVGNGTTEIFDTEVPLAVRLDDGNDGNDVNEASIEDEETPLSVTEDIERKWWYWTLIIIMVIAGKTASDKMNMLETEGDDTED